jgi:hypothetical protein
MSSSYTEEILTNSQINEGHLCNISFYFINKVIFYEDDMPPYLYGLFFVYDCAL